MPSLIAQRIQARLEALGKSASAASLEAGMSRSAIGDIVANDRQSPRIATLKKLTVPLQCTLEYLTLTNDSPLPEPADIVPATVVRVQIAGRVEAGVFVEQDDYSDPDPETIIVARDPRFPRARMVAFRVNGDSMNLAGLQPGDLIIGVDAVDAELPYRDKMLVVVQRTADSGCTIEWTVKELATYRDRIELVPRSSNPRHKPIIVPRNRDDDYESEWLRADDGMEIKVIAIVIRVTKEIPV